MHCGFQLMVRPQNLCLTKNGGTLDRRPLGGSAVRNCKQPDGQHKGGHAQLAAAVGFTEVTSLHLAPPRPSSAPLSYSWQPAPSVVLVDRKHVLPLPSCSIFDRHEPTDSRHSAR